MDNLLEEIEFSIFALVSTQEVSNTLDLTHDYLHFNILDVLHLLHHMSPSSRHGVYFLRLPLIHGTLFISILTHKFGVSLKFLLTIRCSRSKLLVRVLNLSFHICYYLKVTQ
jgi:hypothetical protein